MAGSVGISLVRNGLTLALDAGDSQSYLGSGTRWFDLSRNNGTCTLYGSPSYSSSNLGSLNFNGSSQYATITNSSFVNFASGTASVWFRCSALPVGMLAPIVAKGTLWDGGGGWYIVLSPSREIRAGYINPSFGSGPEVGSRYISSTLNTWHNVVFTFSPLGMSLYLNESLLERSGEALAVVNSDINLAKSDASGVTLFTGNISVVHLYNRVLTRQEVSQNFNALRGRFGV